MKLLFENEATLGQIKRGESVQCIACATKISLKDENGRVTKVTKQVQNVMEYLEKTVADPKLSWFCE